MDKNHALPSTVNIDGNSVNMYTYLYLASTSVQNVYNNNPSSVIALSYKPPEAYKEDIRQGYMSKAEYIHIADVVKVYMDKTGYVPGYAYGTSLGTYFGWKSMIYMYSSILSSTTTSLPSSINVKPWKVLSDPNWATFSNDQVVAAANNVKNSIETNKQLPTSVTVNGKQISTYSFLYLMSTVVQNLYNHNNNPVYSMSFNGPQASNDAIYTGNMALSEYIHIADQVKVYMDKTRITPGYAYGTSLGTYFGWKSMTYMYTKILASYSAQKLLPSAIYVKPIKALSDSSAIISPPKMEVIVTGTGGDITKNYPIMQNIPKSYITTKIIDLAKNGTPMITFGNGTGPKVMITAGVHGNELPAQIAAIKLINYLYGMKISGTIYIVPFIAPSSTSTTTRFWNGQNLNSIANIAGTPTNQIKNLALRLKVNALGDFHSSQPGGVPGKNSALCSKSPTYGSYLIASYIAGQTGSALIAYNRAGVDYPGALEDVTNLAGIPAVTCEVLSSHGTVASGSVSISYNQMMAYLRYYGIL